MSEFKSEFAKYVVNIEDIESKIDYTILNLPSELHRHIDALTTLSNELAVLKDTAYWAGE